MGITVSIPHRLGRAQARQRIETGFANIIRQLPGSGATCSERWDGDRLIFGVAAMGQTISGVVRTSAGNARLDPPLGLAPGRRGPLGA